MQPTKNNNLVNRENAAPLTSTVFGWWRQDVPLEVSYRYWRDVHGVLISRVPGIYQYRQLSLDPIRSDMWSPLDGINYDLPTADQPHGITEILFLDDEDLQAFSSSPLQSKYIYKDEHNLCDRNVTLWSINGNAHTYIDRTEEATPSGEPAFPSFVVCFQQANGTTIEEFRHHLVEQLVRPWSEQNEVMRLRLHLLEPFDASKNSPGMSHEWSPEKQYQAWIELMLRDETAGKRLFSSNTESNNHAQFIKAIHTFPLRALYTFVYDSKPTVVGLRGFSATQTIEQAGADIQRSADLLEVLYGNVVHGLSTKRLSN